MTERAGSDATAEGVGHDPMTEEVGHRAMAAHISAETGARMLYDTRPITFTYAGHSVTVPMPGWYGASDEDAVFEREGQIAWHRAMTVLKARAAGLLEPADIRRIRKKLRLTQRQAATRLGGGPAAFQKYEAGDVMVSHAMSNLLRLLDRDPGLLEVLGEGW